MTKKQAFIQKKVPKKDPSPEEERTLSKSTETDIESPELSMLQDQFGLEMLQDQVGNLATQQVLTQGNGGLVAEAGPGALAQVQRQLEEESKEEEPETVEEESAVEEGPVAEEEPEVAEQESAVEEEPAAEKEPAEAGEEEIALPDELAAAEGAVTEEELNAVLEQQAEAENEQDNKEALEVGDIEIKKPKIEYYDIKAATLEQAIAEIEDPEEWYEFEFEYDTDTENDIIIKANITIEVKIRVPRWTGPGWEDAMPTEQGRWQEMMAAFQIYDDEYDDTSELPQSVLLGPAWEDAPDALKTEWRSMMQDIQDQEEGLLDLVYRRSLVLQQRLLNQPEKETNTIFDQFIEDLKKEEDEYDRQRDVEKEPEISLSENVLVQ